MIIEQLRRLAEREQLLADEGYGPHKIHYLLSIDRDGNLLGMTSTLEPPASGKGKPQPKLFSVPSPIGRRTSGDMANFLYDKADYVFGMGDPTKAANRKKLFRDAIDEALDETGDEGLRAVRAFLDRVDRREIAIDLGDAPDGAVFTFLDFEKAGRLISSRPVVRAFWTKRRASAGGDAGETACIVCGARGGIVRNHPEIKNIPGGNAAGVALVSFNNPAGWSHGFADDDRHFNAPFCRACADAYTRALNRLLAPEPGFPSPTDPTTTLAVQNYRLSSDTVAVFWSTFSDFASRFGRALHGDPNAVKELFRSPFAGRPVELEADRFFAIILSGAQGRAILRSAFHSTVAEVRDNLREHFEDLALVPQYPTEPEIYGLREIVLTLKPPGASSTIAPSLVQQMFGCALLGRLYPQSLLDTALRRLRAGDPFTRPRISIIKAVLNRRRRFNDDDQKELTMALDPENNETGYRLGRLFAVLERLQGDAINQPNATIVDRYYGSASATPAVVFPRLIGLAHHHASKSARGGFFQKLIEEIAWGLDPNDAFPSTLSLDQQGLFALGYYHQRAELWRKKDGGDDSQPNA